MPDNPLKDIAENEVFIVQVDGKKFLAVKAAGKGLYDSSAEQDAKRRGDALVRSDIAGQTNAEDPGSLFAMIDNIHSGYISQSINKSGQTIHNYQSLYGADLGKLESSFNGKGKAAKNGTIILEKLKLGDLPVYQLEGENLTKIKDGKTRKATPYYGTPVHMNIEKDYEPGEELKEMAFEEIQLVGLKSDEKSKIHELREAMSRMVGLVNIAKQSESPGGVTVTQEELERFKRVAGDKIELTVEANGAQDATLTFKYKYASDTKVHDRPYRSEDHTITAKVQLNKDVKSR